MGADPAPVAAERAPSVLARARRWAPQLSLSGWTLLVLAAWLAVPRPDPDREPRLPAVRAVLVDASASVTRLRRGWTKWVRGRLLLECEAAGRAGEELLVVVFAADVTVVYGPGPPDRFDARLSGTGGDVYTPGVEPGRALASDLAGALDVAEGAIGTAGRAPGRIVLLSDGRTTGVDPAPRLARIARARHELEWADPPPPDLAELELVGVRAPRWIEGGAPLVFAVELAHRPAPGEEFTLALDVSVDGDGTAESFGLTLPEGIAPGPDGRVAWLERVVLDALEPGRHRVTVTASLRDPRTGRRVDPVPENDSAGFGVRVGDALVYAALASPASRPAVEALFGAEPWDGVRFDWIELEALGATLPEVDALVTFDVGPAELPPAVLRQFVLPGGGWLASGGWSFLAGFGPRAPREPEDARDLLPLRPPEGDDREREVILLVDGSGSMAGEPFERVRAAIFEIALGASLSDRLILRFFTGAMGGVEYASSGATLRERRRGLAKLLDAKVPRGQTDIFYSLNQLAGEREGAEVPALVLLLTDGQSGSGMIRPLALRERLSASRTDLVMLAIGDDPDREFLSRLLLEGEELVEARDLRDLAELLHREIDAERVRRDDEGIRWLGAGGGVAGSIAADVLDAQRGIGLGAGALFALVRAELAPGAAPIWVTGEGEPLLAVMPVGEGLVAALATAPTADWAPFLARNTALLEPLVRALARGPGRREPGPEIRAAGGELVIERVPADWPADLVVRIHEVETRGPFGVPTPGRTLGEARLALAPAGAGLDPRERRSGPSPAFLDAVTPDRRLRAEVLDGERVLVHLPLVPPGPRELAGAGRAVERRPAAPGGEPRAPGRAPHPGAPWALATALGLLFLGAVLRSPGGQGIRPPGRS